MSKRTHLFVAPQSAPFGEALLGMRVAGELQERGDEIVVFAHESLSILVQGKPYRFIPIPTGKFDVSESIGAVASEVQAASVVLLDATGVYMMLKREGTDATFLRTVNRRVIGLDVWNLRLSGLEWDLVGTKWQHSRYSLDVTRRLIPVPFSRPTGSKGLYNAFPKTNARMDPLEREEMRADFGAREGDRIVLLTSARWQDPQSQAHESGQRLATLFPKLVASRLAQLGSRVHVVHVGPARDAFDVLGDRYTWVPQRSPSRFAKLLAAADLLLSFNFSATTIVSAIAARVPVVLGVNSHAGTTADAIAAKLTEPPSPALRAWLDEAAPLPQFRVWPLGLFKFLAPLARDNPYTNAVALVEVLEEGAFVRAMESLLFDEEARAALRARQAAYCAEVEALPRAADLVESYLAS